MSGLTVKQLIDSLSGHPEDMEVIVYIKGAEDGGIVTDTQIADGSTFYYKADSSHLIHDWDNEKKVVAVVAEL